MRDDKAVTLIKALLSARDILLEEFQNLSKAIDQAFDFTDFISGMDDTEYIDVLMPPKVANRMGGVSGQGKPQNGLEVQAYLKQYIIESLSLSRIKFCFMIVFLPIYLFYQRTNGGDQMHQSRFGSHISHHFHSLGDQLLYLWSSFLKFHRYAVTSYCYYCS